ncbi:MAG TPA: hypothetical protein VM533_06585 [Fimbriiglobus sp.]|jgi:hypothetical protein|nr:hypothetical protein [Fimbriiglobus sp.]
MTTGPDGELTPKPYTLPVGLIAASAALAVVFLIAPIRDGLVLAGLTLLVGAVAAVIMPTWFHSQS